MKLRLTKPYWDNVRLHPRGAVIDFPEGRGPKSAEPVDAPEKTRDIPRPLDEVGDEPGTESASPGEGKTIAKDEPISHVQRNEPDDTASHPRLKK